MKPIPVLGAAVILAMVSNVGFAQTSDDCRLTCARDRDTRNAVCPATYYNDADSIQARDQCLKKSQADYYGCIAACPSPPPAPGASGGPVPSPAPMGY